MMKRILGNLKFSTIDSLIHQYTDAYKGLHFTPLIELNQNQFQTYISRIIKERQNTETTSIWIGLKGSNLKLVSSLCNNYLFKIHRGKDHQVWLYRWMRKEKDLVVPYSMFFNSCGGVIIKNQRLLLMEQKKGQRKGEYGIPGGRADFGEDLKACVERQMLEQMGIKAEYKYLLYIRELSNYTYNSMDIYHACYLSISDEQIKKIKICNEEVEKIEWVHLKELRDFMKNRSIGTQQKLANYISDLYNQGFNFQAQIPNERNSFIYSFNRPSGSSGKNMLFVEHKLVKPNIL